MIIGESKRRKLIRGNAPENLQIQIKEVLKKFQDGYTKRDVKVIDEYMEELFLKDEDVLIVGTGDDEWFLGFEEAKELVESDWKYWGDASIDIDGAAISSYGDVAWVTTEGMLKKVAKADEFYNNYVEGIKEDMSSELPAKDKLIDTLKTVASCFYEVNLGEGIIRPFKFSAVLVKKEEKWKFHNMHFSHPTVWPADVRVVGDKRMA